MGSFLWKILQKDLKFLDRAAFLLLELNSQIVSVDTLELLPPNQLGEIWVRGPNMMQG